MLIVKEEKPLEGKILNPLSWCDRQEEEDNICF